MTSERQGPAVEELLSLLDRRSERNGDQTVPSESTSMVTSAPYLGPPRKGPNYPRITLHLLETHVQSYDDFLPSEKGISEHWLETIYPCLHSHCMPGPTVWNSWSQRQQLHAGFRCSPELRNEWNVWFSTDVVEFGVILVRWVYEGGSFLRGIRAFLRGMKEPSTHLCFVGLQ